MNKDKQMVKLRPCLFAAGLLAIFLILPGGDPAHAQLFTGDQRSEIERIVKEYLLSHPELLQDAMTELDKRQTAAATEKASRRGRRVQYRNFCFAPPRLRLEARRGMSPWSSSLTTIAATVNAR
jgi:Copper resistance protein ScsC N-terminal domain